MRRKTVATVEKILLRVAIYIRLSTDRQVKEGDSMRDQLLLDDVRAGKIDLVIFTRLDRWFRNLRHYLNTQRARDIGSAFRTNCVTY